MTDNELFGNSEQLESSSCGHKKDHVADPGKMVGDLISRAEAIETVRKAKSIGQAHRMLVQLPSAQPGWIPVTERLPERTDTYLVQVGINENGEGMHTEARTADWNAVWQTWYVHTTRCLVGDIIKWMPIPWEGSDRHE